MKLIASILLGLSLLATPVLAQANNPDQCVSPAQMAQIAKKYNLTRSVLFEGDSLKQFKENNDASNYKPIPEFITGIMIFPEGTSVWQVVLFADGCAITQIEVPQDVLVPLMDGIKVNNQ